jgi:hypothetical protein
MGWLLAAAGTISTIQGVAWVGAATSSRGRTVLGVIVGALGLVALTGGVLHALLPSFFAG